MTIRAEAHSDDRIQEVNFDATPWFEKATAEEIQDLSDCHWGGDYPADNIAILLAERNKELGDLFKYLELIQGKKSKKDECGFECHINEEDAKKWLAANRPEITILDWDR